MERRSLFCGLKVEWEVVVGCVDDLYHHVSIQSYDPNRFDYTYEVL